MTHTIEIPNWIPTSENAWDGCHWARRRKLKAGDREMVCTYAAKQAIETNTPMRANGKRRVSLEVVFGAGHRGRKPDPSNLWKSLLDALKHARLIVDDSIEWCETGSVVYSRGNRRGTRITLEDV